MVWGCSLLMIKADSVILCAVVLMDKSSLKVNWYFVFFLDSGLHHLYFLYSPSFTILNFISREALAPSKFRLSYLASSLPQCSCLTPEACHRQMTHRAFKGSWVPGSRRVWLRNIKHVHMHVHAPLLYRCCCPPYRLRAAWDWQQASLCSDVLNGHGKWQLLW